jgi:23S rRNA (cytidine1920-2'-O)/16S rRNA (cytidine1409-2'-O)-methyltransferase
LADHELAADTKEAAAFIMAGLVFFGDRRIEKPGERVPEGWQLSVKGKGHPYVSRGGVKLAAALKEWELSVLGKVGLDLGSSTGGFTDCMLQAGAAKVYAVDAGRNQLDWKLRNDPRVVAMEGTNARDLKPEDLGGAADFATLDLSFISLEKVLPVLLKIVKPSGFWVALIKPQFEAEKHEVPEGGVVTDPGLQKKICDKIWVASESMGLGPLKLMKSPISGKDGNIEFLLLGQIK